MSPQPLFLPVAEAYNRWSPFYDAYDNPMVFMAAEIVNRTLADITSLSVFEFGCGTGRNLAALAARGATPTAGCDLSEGMLTIARTRLPHARLFHHDMANPLPIPNDAFHRTLFSLTLEHLADLRAPLSEARRITKPDGRIHLIEIHPFYSLAGAAAHFDHQGQEVRMPTYPHQFENYLQTFHELGLSVTACREWKPADIGNPPQLQNLKRGPTTPLTLEFTLAK